MTTIGTLLIFAAAIVLMVVAIARWKVHPFLAILGTAILLAVVLGVPYTELPDVIGKGFGGVFSGIALVIIFGTLIGSVLERTGGAVALARAVERVVGKRHPRLAMMLIGWIVSIPVFCDSGFVLVSPIGKSLARRSGTSPVPLMLALAAGLFASHVFIPPTPGPVAAAGMVGLENNLLLVIGLGAVISLLSLIPAYWFSGRFSNSENSEGSEGSENSENSERQRPNCGATLALLPILLPIVLMALGSVASLVAMPEGITAALTFLGKPVIALMIATLSCLPLLMKAKTTSLFYDITQSSLQTAGPIIFITAAGGVLGAVVVASGFVDIIKESGEALKALGVVFPFLIAAILKSAQGSSTVAITTTASMMGLFSDSGSMMNALGFTSPLAAALVVMAIGAGAMTVSHANDSYFWVVTGFGGIKARDGYRTMTLMTLLMGLTAIAVIALAAALLL
ncbi:MAG: GntP family permease [Muribaculaceae bacterium]|nr:GntP family permease [Muribaculaceae bacterium]